MAPSRILDGSASGMGRSTECLCYSVDGEFCRKESLRQLFLKILVCLWSADGSADVMMCSCVCRHTMKLSPKFQSSNTCSNGRVHKLTQMVEFINPRKWQSPKTRSNGKVRNGTFTNCKGRSRPYFYLY